MCVSPFTNSMKPKNVYLGKTTTVERSVLPIPMCDARTWDDNIGHIVEIISKVIPKSLDFSKKHVTTYLLESKWFSAYLDAIFRSLEIFTSIHIKNRTKNLFDKKTKIKKIKNFRFFVFSKIKIFIFVFLIFDFFSPKKNCSSFFHVHVDVKFSKDFKNRV